MIYIFQKLVSSKFKYPMFKYNKNCLQSKFKYFHYTRKFLKSKFGCLFDMHLGPPLPSPISDTIALCAKDMLCNKNQMSSQFGWRHCIQMSKAPMDLLRSQKQFNTYSRVMYSHLMLQPISSSTSSRLSFLSRLFKSCLKMSYIVHELEHFHTTAKIKYFHIQMLVSNRT